MEHRLLLGRKSRKFVINRLYFSPSIIFSNSILPRRREVFTAQAMERTMISPSLSGPPKIQGRRHLVLSSDKAR